MGTVPMAIDPLSQESVSSGALNGQKPRLKVATYGSFFFMFYVFCVIGFFTYIYI